MPDHDPFLDPEPPPWLARLLPPLLLAMFGLAVVLSVVVRVQETATGYFTVVGEAAVDPVRASLGGMVVEIAAVEGAEVELGAALLVVRSDALGELAAERVVEQRKAESADDRTAALHAQFEAEQAGRTATLAVLDLRIAQLSTGIPAAQRRASLAGEKVSRSSHLHEEGVVSDEQWADVRFAADGATVELARLQADLAEAQADWSKLAHEVDAAQAEFTEKLRQLEVDNERASMRASSITASLGEGVDLAVVAPCAGKVARLAVRASGAVVRAGEVVAEVTCAGQALQAELYLPSSRGGRVAEGQRVRLRYDAFPYQRYGLQGGTVSWVSPSAMDRTFRLNVALDHQEVADGDRSWPLREGMGGQADVVIGHRPAITYAFEPLRAAWERLVGVGEAPE